MWCGRGWLRYRVPRTLCIAACGGCVVYGRTRSDRDFEFLGYRAVFVPLIAWLASYMSLTFVFDVVVYAITFGALEWENLSEGRGTRSSSRREVVVRRVALVLRQIVTGIWGFTHRSAPVFCGGRVGREGGRGPKIGGLRRQVPEVRDEGGPINTGEEGGGAAASARGAGEGRHGRRRGRTP